MIEPDPNEMVLVNKTYLYDMHECMNMLLKDVRRMVDGEPKDMRGFAKEILVAAHFVYPLVPR